MQRQLHRPRRAGEAGARPRQRRGRRRLALRPRPLRLRDVRRRGAGRRAAAAQAAPRPSWERGDRGRGRGPRRGRRHGARRSSATPPTRRATWSSASLREALGSPHIDSRLSRGPRRETLVRLAQPELSAKVRDIDDADADPRRSAPTRCTARRSSTCASARRSAATAPSLVVATERPTTARRRRRGDRPLRPTAQAPTSSPSWRGAARRRRERRHASWPSVLRERRQRSSSSSGASAIGREARRDRRPARRSPRPSTSPAPTAPACSKSPTPTNARGLREAGCLPDAGPGSRAETAGSAARGSTEEIRAGAESGELKASILFGVDPLRDFPTPHAWEAALAAADFVVSLLDASRTPPPPRPTSSSRSRPTPRKTAPSPTPTAASQRVRPIRRPPRRHPPQHAASSPSSPLASATTPASLPALGLRRSHRGGPLLRRHRPTPTSAAAASAGRTPARATTPGPGRGSRALTLPDASRDSRPAESSGVAPSCTPHSPSGTYRDLWAGPITELQPAAEVPRARSSSVEMSLADAERLGLQQSATSGPGRPERAPASRPQVADQASGSAEASVFLVEGVADGNANALLNGGPVSVDDRARSRLMMLPLADADFVEATWIMVVKSLVIFAVIFGDPAGADRGRAQADRPLPAPLRPEPGRPLRAAAAARRRRQADLQAALPARERDPDAVRARAAAAGHLRRAARWRSSPGATSRTASASTGSTSRSAILYFFAVGSIAFYGLLLGGWASGSKYSLLGAMRARRAADLLRGLDGPGAARRDHDGRLALAGRRSSSAQGDDLVHRPAVRRLPDLHAGRLRRDQPHRRSTCPRPTPSWSRAS